MISQSHQFLFFSFFLFLDQANSIPVQGKPYCLLKMEFLLVSPYLKACLRELMDFGTLSCLLAFSGIFLFKISLSDKRPAFSSSEVSSSVKKVKASYKKQADNSYLTLVVCKA